MAGMFRIATYNIQKSIGLDGRRRPQRILDVIEELDADIVALQEADRRFGHRRSTLPTEMIAAVSGYDVVPVAAAPESLGWHGNAILVRRPVRILDQQRLRLPMLEPRGAVIADVEVAGTPLRIVAAHLSLFRRYRRKQFAAIAAELQGAENEVATIILGDFNEWRRADDSLRAPRGGFRDAAAGNSYPAVLPAVGLDRIVTCPRLRVHAAGAHRSRKARIASDHLPVWAELSFDGQPASDAFGARSVA